MSLYTFSVKAGAPFYVKTPGTVLLVDSVSVSAGVDITLIKNGAERPKMPGRKAAFKINDDFDELILASAVDITVALFISFNDVNLGFQDGANVNIPNGVNVTNAIGSPVPVTFTQVIQPLGSVTVNNTPAQAVPIDPGSKVFLTQEQRLATVVNIAPVIAGLAQVQLVNDPTLLNYRARNTSATAKIGIGATGVTMANAAIVLLPGETFFEDDAAGASWFVISDTAGTQVNILGLKP
jgi:hypothetical protein